MENKAEIQQNKLIQIGKFNADVWHLQCRNIRKIDYHST